MDKAKIVENQTPNCENLFIVPTIGLLLQVHNKKVYFALLKFIKCQISEN